MFHVGSMLSHSFDIHTISIHALNLCITKLQRPRITRLLDSVQLPRATPTSLPSALHIRLVQFSTALHSCAPHVQTTSRLFDPLSHKCFLSHITQLCASLLSLPFSVCTYNYLSQISPQLTRNKASTVCEGRLNI